MKNNLYVVHCAYEKGYTLHLTFSDGFQGSVDLTEELWGPVFEPLKNVELFAKATVNTELRTVSWPNGADFAPEYLRELSLAEVSTAHQGG